MRRFIHKELLYGVQNYNPIKVCLVSGKDIFVTDSDKETTYSVNKLNVIEKDLDKYVDKELKAKKDVNSSEI